MASRVKPPSGWGTLNVALNGLVKQGVIVSYSTGLGQDTTASIEAVIDRGGDQAEIVRKIRFVLPEAFAEARVRTRVA